MLNAVVVLELASPYSGKGRFGGDKLLKSHVYGYESAWHRQESNTVIGSIRSFSLAGCNVSHRAYTFRCWNISGPTAVIGSALFSISDVSDLTATCATDMFYVAWSLFNERLVIRLCSSDSCIILAYKIRKYHMARFSDSITRTTPYEYSLADQMT